jgi:hypothetical protein
VLLGSSRDAPAIVLGTIGLVIALTAGAIVSLYVEQVSAIFSTLLNGGLLFAVVHYRNRFLAPEAPARQDPAAAALPSLPG